MFKEDNKDVVITINIPGCEYVNDSEAALQMVACLGAVLVDLKTIGYSLEHCAEASAQLTDWLVGIYDPKGKCAMCQKVATTDPARGKVS